MVGNYLLLEVENKPVMFAGAVKRVIQGNQRRAFSK